MSKFSLTDLLNAKSKPTTSPGDDTLQLGAGNEDFTIKLISVYDLEPSEDNFYSVDYVDDLKDSIEILGIQQNLTVKPIIGTDKYKLISGHRRRLASLKLVQEGKEQFQFVPCRVESDIDEIKEKIILIYTNSTTRQLSNWEKIEQLNQLKTLLTEYKRTHEIPGRVRDLLAETLNVSPSQVARMESINNNLLPELKEELKQDKINFSAAAELSRLSIVDQQAVYEQHKQAGVTNLSEVRAKKEKIIKLQNHEESNPTVKCKHYFVKTSVNIESFDMEIEICNICHLTKAEIERDKTQHMLNLANQALERAGSAARFGLKLQISEGILVFRDTAENIEETMGECECPELNQLQKTIYFSQRREEKIEADAAVMREALEEVRLTLSVSLGEVEYAYERNCVNERRLKALSVINKALEMMGNQKNLL